MSSASIIFCAPDFLKMLKTAFPDTTIYPFSSKVDDCRQSITQLEGSQERSAIFLYQPVEMQSTNRFVKDHINLSPENPLIGPTTTASIARFPDMSNVYEDKEGIVAVFGEDEDLNQFDESWAHVTAGIWEAIALKNIGLSLRAWLISDLEKWISEYPELN